MRLGVFTSFNFLTAHTLLFILYINDLSTVCKKSTLIMFADDSTVVKNSSENDLLLQIDVEKVFN